MSLAPLAASGGLVVTLDDLVAWGTRFGAAARPPVLITLSGELGAGKTALVQAICRGYGVTEPVTSPTFALVHEYAAPRSQVFHLDLYRLNQPADLEPIGWREIVSARALVLLEWPDRAGTLLPAEHVPIRLEHVPDDARRRILLAG